MADRTKIQMDLIKLVGGERLLRLTDPESGLTLEKKLDAKTSVVRQTETLLGALEAAMAKAALVAG